MSSNLMDTEAGGETPQYESIQTVTKPHSKQGGHMGGFSNPNFDTIDPLLRNFLEGETQPDAVTSQQEHQKAARGDKTAENVRYGQKISEEGLGGKTTEAGGIANQDGFGATHAQERPENAEESRRDQGYRSGTGVGG